MYSPLTRKREGSGKGTQLSWGKREGCDKGIHLSQEKGGVW